jgi:hypothetical protein
MSLDHLQITLAEKDQQDRFDPPESRYRLEVNWNSKYNRGKKKFVIKY